MSVQLVSAGDLVVLDPSDKRTIAFDWDAENLSPTATISASVFTIKVIRQRGLTALTKDNELIMTAAQATIALQRTVTVNSRATLLRLIASTATVGDEYDIANLITTTETPSQDKEQSIRVLIQNR